MAQRLGELLARARAINTQMTKSTVAGDAEALERDAQLLQTVAHELRGILAPLRGQAIPSATVKALKLEFASLAARLKMQREQVLRRKAWVDRNARHLMGSSSDPTYSVGRAGQQLPVRH